MDPLNALFWNLVSGWKNLKRNPNLHTLRIDDAIAPQPPAFDLLTPKRLITTTTTTTMADNMLVFVPQKILSLSGLLGQNILLL